VLVAESPGPGLDGLSLDQLEDEIATLASHIYAGTCRWLELVGELDRRGGFTESGSGPCAEWLAWRCALAPRAAREHVRVARRLPELPLIHAAFGSGELSYAKVRALTRVADEDSEEELLELARHLTAAQLERAVRAYRRVSVDEAKALEDAAHLGYYWDEDGSLVIRAGLAPEDGVLFLRALEAARDLLQERAWEDERGSAEPREPARRPNNAEALAALADLALAGRTDGRPGGERYQLVVHVDEAAVTATRARARSRTAPRSRHRRRGGLPATPRSSSSGNAAASRCQWGGKHARSRLRCGERCRRATAAAASPAVRTAVSCTGITSVIGRAEAKRSSGTWCSSAGTTIAVCTKAATRSSSKLTEA
jgi:Domain of unknown function (DUF222)